MGITQESDEGEKIVEWFDVDDFPYAACLLVDEKNEFHFLGTLENDERTVSGLTQMLTISLD